MPGLALLVRRILVLLLMCSSTVAYSQVEDWKNLEGNTMRAELTGYDLESKELQFELEDGSPFTYSLIELDVSSKLRVLKHPDFLDWARAQGWEEPTLFERVGTMWGTALIAWACYMLVVSLVHFVCFWGSARLLTGESEFRMHLLGWLKLIVTNVAVYVLFLLVIQLLGFLLGVFQSGSDPDDVSSSSAAFSCLFLIVAVALFVGVPALVIRHHYNADSWWVGIGTLILTNMVLCFLSLVFLGVLLLVGQQYADTIITDWILRPMDLV